MLILIVYCLVKFDEMTTGRDKSNSLLGMWNIENPDYRDFVNLGGLL